MGQGERIPSFRETLDYFAEVSAERVRQGLAPLIIHAELKGKRTEEFVAPVVKEYVEQGKLRLEDFVFGSFRHDEIKALKEAEPDFPVSIYLRTKMLFGESNIVMPGWHVKEGADYDPVCLEYLRNMRRATGVVAFDPVLWDIYEPLVQVAKEEGAEMHISTSDIRVFDHDHLVTVLAIARSGVKTSFKTDEPALVRKALEELDATYNAAFSSPIQNVTHAEVIGDDKRGSFASAAAETISWVRRTLSRPIHPRPQGYIASMASEPAPGAGK